MKNSRLAARYAKALYEVADSMQQVDVVFNNMNDILEITTSHKDVAAILANPLIRNDKKIKILDTLLEDKVSNIVIKFINLIIKKNREINLPEISNQFIKLYYQKNNIMVVDLITSEKIDETIREKINALLKKIIDKQILFNEILNKNIIGGFIIRFDNKQIDQSLLRKLQILQKEFNINLYIKKY